MVLLSIFSKNRYSSMVLNSSNVKNELFVSQSHAQSFWILLHFSPFYNYFFIFKYRKSVSTWGRLVLIFGHFQYYIWYYIITYNTTIYNIICNVTKYQWIIFYLSVFIINWSKQETYSSLKFQFSLSYLKFIKIKRIDSARIDIRIDITLYYVTLRCN